jgi:hypothetical protein
MKKKFCKDCNKEIKNCKSIRCRSCAQKLRRKTEPSPWFIDGRSSIKKYCVDCKKEISRGSDNRCRKCEDLRKIIYKELKKCPDCGKNINRFSERCASCARRRATTIRLSNPKNHWNWQNGKSFEEYGQEFDDTLKEQIRFRDKYKCRECGCSQLENGRQLDCHHIDYNKKNNNISNLISLCMKCHRKTTSNKDYWIKYYTDNYKKNKMLEIF